MLAKMKLGATERIFFDGDTLTNGSWLAPACRVKLSDKGLQALIDAGQKFSRDASGLLETGDNARCPDVAAIVGPAKAEDVTAAEVSPLSYQFTKMYETKETVCRIIISERGIMLIDSKFMPLVEAADEVLMAAPHKALQLRFNGDGIGLIMPIRNEGEPLEAAEAIVKASQ